ncbi:MlaD family protein, partial [Nocardia sp. NPDC060220]
MIKPRVPAFLRHNRHLRLGLIAALAVLVLLGGSNLLNQVQLGDKTVHAEFAQAAGLRPGATVDVSGIEVGEVQAVKLVNDRVEVALRIRKDIRLGANAHAAIKMSTILGRLHIVLRPGDGKE